MDTFKRKSIDEEYIPSAEMISETAKRNKELDEKGYSEEKITAFRKGIKQVSDEKAKELGIKLLSTITKKGYVQNENPELIKSLILEGANLEVRHRKTGATALTFCARKNLYATFKQLVIAGADINAESKTNDGKVRGTTATIWSARKGHHEILADLILLGADLNHACTDGDTALHSAAIHNQTKSVEMLKEAGAILNAKNNAGEDAIKKALTEGNSEIINNISESLSDSPYNFSNCTTETVSDELDRAKELLKSFKNK